MNRENFLLSLSRIVKEERVVNCRFKSNTYILIYAMDENVWLVDPGDVQAVFHWMQENDKKNVSGILLTHAHFDHLYGINDVLEKFPQCPVYVANEYGKTLLFDPRKNSSYYALIDDIVIFEDADVRVYDSSLSLWPGVMLNVFHTPGHSDDSVCLQVENLLFTGDTLIYNLRTVTKLRGGDTLKLKESLETLQSLSGKGLHVFPGHGEEFELDGYDLRKAVNGPSLRFKKEII